MRKTKRSKKRRLQLEQIISWNMNYICVIYEVYMNMNYICVIYRVYSIYFLYALCSGCLSSRVVYAPQIYVANMQKKPKAERDTTTTTITAAAAAGQRLVLHCVWICGSGEEA